jgi:tetratricopeptide (TPR) repeat protein
VAKAKVYYFARKPAVTVKICRELLEMEPGYGAAIGVIGFAYLEMGRVAEAIEQFKSEIDRLPLEQSNTQAAGTRSLDRCSDPEAFGCLGYAYGIAGERSKALDVLGELLEVRKTRYIQPQNVALVYIGLGEYDSAFEWLDRAYIDRCGPLTYLKVWPFIDRLRSDPRYIDLITRLGLPL